MREGPNGDAQAAGGLGICGEVFSSPDDPDYRRLLSGVQEAKAHLDSISRFNLPGFRPEPEYIREMKRCGILPQTQRNGDPINVYELDRRYWESFWHHPAVKPTGGR